MARGDFETCELGATTIDGMLFRIGDLAPDGVIERIWAVYRKGTLTGIKIAATYGEGLAHRRVNDRIVPYFRLPTGTVTRAVETF